MQKRQVKKRILDTLDFVCKNMFNDSDTNSLLTVIEAPSPQKEPKSVLLQLDRSSSNGRIFITHSTQLADDKCE